MSEHERQNIINISLERTLSLLALSRIYLVCFFFNDTATTEIYTLSLHDALPISSSIATRSASRCPIAPAYDPAPSGDRRRRGTGSQPPARASGGLPRGTAAFYCGRSGERSGGPANRRRGGCGDRSGRHPHA